MSPDPNLPEQATLAALGLDKALPSGARVDHQAEVREVQDTAAMTWLALTELQPAPDAVWQGIRAELKFDGNDRVPERQNGLRWFNWGGWAAAALLALAWWLQEPPQPGTAPVIPSAGAVPETVRNASRAPSAPAGSQPLQPVHDTALRQELGELRRRLADALSGTDSPGLHRPAILELRVPGSVGADAPEGAAARLQQLVTQALPRDLMLRQARDTSTLILENGWPKAGWITGESGQTIRHLSFPADQWEELGLWKAPDQFYDPATSLSWAPAPDGLGYLGRVSPSVPDPAGFEMPRPRDAVTESQSKEPAAAPAPTGYLVSDPGTSEATLLLADLPPAAPGTQHMVVATAADGSRQQYQINASDFSGEGTRTASLTLSSLSLPGHFTNFSVVQFTSNDAVTSGNGLVLLSGGLP